MNKLVNDSVARSKVESDVRRIAETLEGNQSFSKEEYNTFVSMRKQGVTAQSYSAGRTKEEVAIKLGTSSTALSNILHGQRILDIGGGVGTFADGVTKDKSTSVILLETDKGALEKVPEKKNLVAMEGNGYDLIAAGLEPESFDSVFVTYSTNFWANNSEEVVRSFTEPLKVLKPGGTAYITPITQNLGLNAAFLSGFLPEHPYNPGNEYSKVFGIFVLNAYATVLALEEQEVVTSAFRASKKNAQFKPLILPNGYGVAPDSYSVALTKN